jgi:hypothetical protein
MDTCRLRLKLGQNELEAEGRRITPEKQREIFLATVATSGNRTTGPGPEKARAREEGEPQKVDLGDGNSAVAANSNLHAPWKI